MPFCLASMNLCHYIGRPLTTQIDISDDFPEVEQEWKIQVSDITARPEYGILNKQVAIAEQEVKLNRSELLPRIGVRGSYDYLHGLEINDETFMKKGAFSVFLNVSVPLFHFGERANKVKSAKAKLEQTRLEQENASEKMLLELMQAANNLDEARLETELSDRSLEQAEENMKVSGKQYEVGLETLSDYLEAANALATGLPDTCRRSFPIVCELYCLSESGGATASDRLIASFEKR